MSENEDIEVEATVDDEVQPPPEKKRVGNSIAWLALLLALVALVAVGYSLFLDWTAEPEVDDNRELEAALGDLGRRIDQTNSNLSDMATSFGALEQADAGADERLDALRLQLSDINDRMQLLNSLPVRIANTESALTALQGVSAGARDNWLLGEAEYYMQLANAQLQLAGNPELAALALGMADERVAQLANPALTNVRIALADEMAALQGMQTPDVQGITLQLASLARSVETLPLRSIERIEANNEAPADDEDLGPLDRAWGKVKEATSDLIRHRTTDEQIMPLISPEAEYFLRTNLALQMQTARLALLRGEQPVYEASLRDASNWLQQYFDPDSAQVAAALESIEALQGGMFAADAPDISESLRLLRRHNSVVESTQ